MQIHTIAAAAVLALSTTGAAQAAQTAKAVIAPTGNHAAQGVKGELILAQDADGVRVTGSISGLGADSEHGFHVHEKGDCSAPDGSSAGGHFNPTAQPHGNPHGEHHHAGDIPNLKAGADGVAKVDATLHGAKLDGEHGLVGRAFVVHADPDDYASQPAGNSGARIACGVIVANAAAE